MILRRQHRQKQSEAGRKISAVQVKTNEMATRCISLVAPPPKLTVSEWADERRILPRTAAEPGRWSTDRTPYLREVMDACSDPSIKKIVMMFASQLGKSECLLNIAGYFMDYDPSPIMIIQPTVEMAKSFSKERLASMIRDCASLSEKVSEPKSRDGSNTILLKEYPGGYVVLIGANAPAGLASRPIRVLLPDEVDRFPISAGSEGDPLSLAEKRQTTFWNQLTVESSTPTVKGASRIESEYELSSKEQWLIPCPSCGHYQPYDWGRLDFDSVCMICNKCGVMHSEFEWKAGTGKWEAQAEHESVRGFHLNAMASPWLRWSDLIFEFKDSLNKGPEVLKTFINTRLAETWEEEGETIGDEVLDLRRHYYNTDIPDRVEIITAGVDVQGDRLEMEVVGWGYGAESWGIQYVVFPGDPYKPDVWELLDTFLMKTYRRADDKTLPISATCVDSGYATSEVYAYCRKRFDRYIFAIKGIGGPGQPEVGAYRRQGKNKNVAVFPVGTDSSKDLLRSRLLIDTEGAGYCHFPREATFSDGTQRGYTVDYFKGLLSERRVERKSQGRVYYAWVKKSNMRNEPLDCRTYASAALRILNPNWDTISERRDKNDVEVKIAQNRRRIISKGISI